MPDASNFLSSLESLTVQNARTALAQGVATVKAGQAQFDLAALSTVDSSAVAVLLGWQRAAREAGASLSFINIPANLCSLATLYGVDAFLGASPANLAHH